MIFAHHPGNTNSGSSCNPITVPSAEAKGTLTFWNDSVIIMKEMADIPSDPNFERFGSSEYTIVFVDECSEISERAIEVLFSRFRWRTHETFKISRMLMSTNPTTNWVRSQFVQDDEGNPAILKEGEAYVPFSVFDNPDIAFRQTYDTMKPLIISWDFNVAPYMSTLLIQIDYDKKIFHVLEEILGKPEDKQNNTPRLAQKIKEKLTSEKHVSGIVVTGDLSEAARSTQTEENVNNYTIIADNLGKGVYKPKIKLLSKQPSQAVRLDFINELLDGYNGWTISIDLRCRKLTEDLIYQRKNSDRTKNKQKVNDSKTGAKYERYGHLSDCFDYAICYFLRESYNKFQKGESPVCTTTVAPVYTTFDY